MTSPVASRPLAARPESACARGVRLVGLLVFGLTLFLPIYGCSGGPAARDPAARQTTQRARDPGQTPIERIVKTLGRGERGDGVVAALWRCRLWYPYLLIPLWLVVLGLSSIGPRTRRLAGGVLLASSIGVAALELAYIDHDWGGLLPPALRRIEVAVAWGVVVVVLFVRRGGRGWLEPEAGVSAQALLSFLHGVMYLAGDAITYVRGGHGAGVIVETLLDDYRIGYWIALAGLLAITGPGMRSPAPVT